MAYKYFDDFGVYLAALPTYYGSVSLFPLLLLRAYSRRPKPSAARASSTSTSSLTHQHLNQAPTIPA